MTSKFRIVPEYTVSARTNARHRIEQWVSYDGRSEFTGTDGEWKVIDVRYSMYDAKSEIDLLIKRTNDQANWEKQNPIIYYP